MLFSAIAIIFNFFHLFAIKDATFVYPYIIDWRASGKLSTPRDQGECGACVGFAVSAALEAQYRISCNREIKPLSPQYVMSCGGGNCSYGINIDDALKYVEKHGVASEACFSYSASDSACHDACEPVLAGIRAEKVTDGELDVREVKYALRHGPVLASMLSYKDLRAYKEGIYETDKKGKGRHAILIVGYNDLDQTFIIENSWGADWGEAGYFKVRQNNSNIFPSLHTWQFVIDCEFMGLASLGGLSW